MKPLEEMSVDELKARIAELEARMDERDAMEAAQATKSRRFKDLPEAEQIQLAHEYMAKNNVRLLEALEALDR